MRVARYLLVLAVATFLSVAYGTRHEDARDRGLPPGRLRRPPAEARPLDATPRRFSLLRQGAACLRRLLVRNRLWARVRLTPTPGPNWAGDLHCLSPPISRPANRLPTAAEVGPRPPDTPRRRPWVRQETKTRSQPPGNNL